MCDIIKIRKIIGSQEINGLESSFSSTLETKGPTNNSMGGNNTSTSGWNELNPQVRLLLMFLKNKSARSRLWKTSINMNFYVMLLALNALPFLNKSKRWKKRTPDKIFSNTVVTIILYIYITFSDFKAGKKRSRATPRINLQFSWNALKN